LFDFNADLYPKIIKRKDLSQFALLPSSVAKGGFSAKAISRNKLKFRKKN